MAQNNQEGTKKVLLATYAIIGLLVFSAVQTAIVGYLNNKHFSEIDMAWSDLSSRHQTKLRMISEIRADIGYGGIIHDFKNYVIRGDDEAFSSLIADFKNFQSDIVVYRDFASTQYENNALNDLATTMESYQKKLFVAQKLKLEGLSVEEIDKQVKVDDAPALEALNTLEEAMAAGFDGALDRVQEEVSSGQTTAAFGLLLSMIPLAVALAAVGFLRVLLGEIKRRTNAETKALGAVGALEKTNRDLADMADAQKSLRVAAESGEKTKAKFLASMSHEIRTPLNAVIGLTELVLKTDLTNYQRGYLSKVSVAGRNLLGLINDILDFSKIEAGKLKIETIEFELDPVLENVSVVVSTKADENDNEVIITVDRSIPNLLFGDPLRIGQVLINLAGNAAKFTQNGEIIIDISMEEGDTNWLVASVQDNGSGMTDEQVAKLFKPFVQADQSVTRTHGGTGLGLSISQQLVEAMGGTLGVESEAGVGSKFFFRIPIMFAENAERRDVFEGIDPRTIRILVVDDNETICETLKLALQKLRFNVDTATSGEDAIEQYKTALPKRPYSALLVDWKMEGIDGLETIKQIRLLEEHTVSAPAISMISASDMSEIKDELVDLGVEYMLQKPINTSFLVDALMAIFKSTSDRRPVRPSTMIESDDNENLNGARILLAEDNELNQMVALGVLQNLGCSVDVAVNGQETIDKLRDKPADHYAIILMDIQMPVMDGLSATRAIRSDLKMTEIPIVAMTAHALEEERERCMDAGMDDHISKPIDARDVKMKIIKWIGAKFRSEILDAVPVSDSASDAVKSIVDVAAIAARLTLPEDMVRKMLLKFCRDYKGTPERLGQLVQDGNLEEAQYLAHSIKGVSGTLGIDDVYRLFSDLETSLKDGIFVPNDWDHKGMTMAFDQIIANIEDTFPSPD